MADPRYARQLPLWGAAGQQALARSRVLVLGAGGLGSVVVPYLAAAGVGTIGVVDDDVVELSNLHRQVMHSMEELGEPKVVSAAVAAARINPEVRVVRHPSRLDAGNADELLAGWDVVVDGFDAFEPRFAAADAAARLGIPIVWGSALGFDGQVAVFADGLTLRSLFPDGATDGAADTCSTVGVLGPVCAAVGGVMAAEALKLLTGAGTPLVGRVLVYDALDATWAELPLRVGGGGLHRPAAPASRPPQSFRRSTAGDAPPRRSTAGDARDGDRGTVEQERRMPNTRTLRAADLPTLRADVAEGTAPVLIDLREPFEFADAAPIEGAISLPFSEFRAGARPDSALRDEPIVVYCAHGVRSELAGTALAAEGWDVSHIPGGIEAFRRG